MTDFVTKYQSFEAFKAADAHHEKERQYWNSFAEKEKKLMDLLAQNGLSLEEFGYVKHVAAQASQKAKPAAKGKKGEPGKHYQWTDAAGNTHIYKGSRPSEALKASKFYVNGAVNTEGMTPIN